MHGLLYFVKITFPEYGPSSLNVKRHINCLRCRVTLKHMTSLRSSTWKTCSLLWTAKGTLVKLDSSVHKSRFHSLPLQSPRFQWADWSRVEKIPRETDMAVPGWALGLKHLPVSSESVTNTYLASIGMMWLWVLAEEEKVHNRVLRYAYRSVTHQWTKEAAIKREVVFCFVLF